MTADDRWAEADRIFDEALDRPAPERAGFVAEACGGDAELRGLVERLLAGAETLDAFLPAGGALEGAFGRSLGRSLDGDSESPFGRTAVHRYRLGAELGRGGMAVVYLGERADGLFEQKVAVKLVKRGSDTDEVLRRFEQERRILASLTHPGIARILDGGAAADGRPFFAMEHVEGRPIDAWCDERTLSLEGRLRLFVRAARAVEYAHHNLVVHRDLKPSNILVTNEGHPKLLDFGIAKLLEDDGSGSDITGSQVRVLTPAFASPEQVRGDPVTTASDVYQLGLLLYILLTGRHPFRGGRESAGALTRRILEDEPPRPSVAARADDQVAPPAVERARARGLTPERLARALAGDLDTIVLTALRKDPLERYRDVGQLVDDVERHLAFEPVRARRAGAAYVTARFVRRHWVLVTVASLGLAGLAGGLLAAWHQARRAEHRFQEVRRLARAMMFDLDERIAPLPGSTPARQFLVATSLSYLDGLLAEADDDPVLRLELAEAYERVGDVQGHPRSPNLGQPQAALASYERALGLRLGPGMPRDARSAPALARLRTRVADALESEGRLDEARRSLEEALATLRPLAATTSASSDRRLLLEALTSLGAVHARANDAAAALAAHREALAAATAWVAADDTPAARRAQAMAEARVANVLAERGDVDASLAGHRRAVAALGALVRAAPDDQGLRRDERLALSWLGNVQGVPGFVNAGDTEGATASYRRVLELSRALTEADPRDARARLDWLNACWRLASILSDRSPAEALALVEQALEALAALRGEAPDSFDLARREVALKVTQADVLVRLDQRERALAILKDARPAVDELGRRAPGDVGARALRRSLLRREGELLRAAGDHVAGRQAHEEALAIAEAWSREKPDDPYALWALAESYAALGRGALLASRERGRPPASRRDEASAAHAWLRRSLEVWEGWPRKASTSAFDRTRRDQAARELAEAERILSVTANGPR